MLRSEIPQGWQLDEDFHHLSVGELRLVQQAADPASVVRRLPMARRVLQFLCGPFGRWVFQDRAGSRGRAQPAAAGEGGHAGPEELGTLVGLCAAVLAARLGVGTAGCRRGDCGGQC